MTSSLSRRSLLRMAPLLVAAPSIVRASSLMPIKAEKPFDWFRDELPRGVSRLPPGEYEFVIIDSFVEFGQIVVDAKVYDMLSKQHRAMSPIRIR